VVIRALVQGVKRLGKEFPGVDRDIGNGLEEFLPYSTNSKIF